MPQDTRYILYVNHKQTYRGSSLREAKQRAVNYLIHKPALAIRVEAIDQFGQAALKPLKNMEFDHNAASWIEHPF